MQQFLFGLFTIGLAVILSNCQPTKPAAPTDIVTTLYLIRHAEKANDGTKDPYLNEEGKKRAEDIAFQFKDKNIKHIYSSDYKRTRQTVEPLAKTLGVEVKIYNPHDLETFKEMLLKKHQAGETVFIVGHSNTTPALVNLIIRKEQFLPIDEADYGDVFKIDIQRNGFKSVKHLKGFNQ